MNKKNIDNIDKNGRVMITESELQEFKDLALKEYGLEPSDEQAIEQGFALLNLFDQMIKERVMVKL